MTDENTTDGAMRTLYDFVVDYAARSCHFMEKLNAHDPDLLVKARDEIADFREMKRDREIALDLAARRLSPTRFEALGLGRITPDSRYPTVMDVVNRFRREYFSDQLSDIANGDDHDPLDAMREIVTWLAEREDD